MRSQSFDGLFFTHSCPPRWEGRESTATLSNRGRAPFLAAPGENIYMYLSVRKYDLVQSCQNRVADGGEEWQYSVDLIFFFKKKRIKGKATSEKGGLYSDPFSCPFLSNHFVC